MEYAIGFVLAAVFIGVVGFFVVKGVLRAMRKGFLTPKE